MTFDDLNEQLRTFGVGLMQKEKISADDLVKTFKDYLEKTSSQPPNPFISSKITDLLTFLG